MGKKIYCSCYNSTDAGNFHIFAETSEGHFGHNVGSPISGTEVESSSTSYIQVVAVPKVTGKYCSWYNLSYSATETQYGLIKYTGTSSTSSQNRVKSSSSSSGENVIVIDEHGTHDGAPTGTTKMPYKQVVGVFHKSTNTGYTFNGWKVSFKRSTGSYYPRFVSTFTSKEASTSGEETTFKAAYSNSNAIIVQLGQSSIYDVTFTALYSSASTKYTLSYDSAGGSPTPSSQSAESGSRITLASAPSRSRYSFDGWKIDGVTYSEGASFTMPGWNTTATAQWTSTKRNYYLYYTLNGGSPSYSSQTCQTGEYFTLQGNPTKSGYDFSGWEIRSGTSSGEILETGKYQGDKYYPSGTATYSFYACATWTKQTPHTLTYKTGYSGGTPPQPVTGLYSGNSVKLASALSRTGYSFGGWYLDPLDKTVAAGGTFSMPAQDVTAEGTWIASTVSLTYKHGYDSGTYGSVSGKTGDVITLMAAQSRAGYNFTGWLIDDYNDDEHSTRLYQAGASYQLKSAATATAQWSQFRTYTISYDKNSSDVTGDDVPSHNVSQGNQTMLKNPDLWKRNGYTFVCWNTNSGGTGTDYNPGQWITPTASMKLYAVWAKPDSYGSQASRYTTKGNTSTTGATESSSTTTGYTFNFSTNVSTGGISISGQSSSGMVGGYSSGGTRYSRSGTIYYVVYDPATGKYKHNGVYSGPNYDYPTGSSSSSVSVTVSVGADDVASDTVSGSTATVPSTNLLYSASSYRGSSSFETVYSESKSTQLTSSSKVWTAPTVANYDFLGWYTMAEIVPYGSSKAIRKRDFSVLLTADRTTTLDVLMKAKYKCTESSSTSSGTRYSYVNYIRLKYRGKLVFVMLDAGDGSVSQFLISARYGEKYGTLPDPTPPSGSSFTGWYTAEVGGTRIYSDSPVSNASDHILYAHYSGAGTSTVTVTFDGMGGTPSYSSRTYTIGSTYSTLPTCSRTGYSSYAWYTEPYGGTAVTTSTIVQKMTPQTLFAHWTVGKYTITLDPNGGTIDTTSIQVVQGEALAWIPTPSLANKYFVGWFTSKTGGDEVTTTTVPTKNMTIYARWSDSGGGGGGGGSSDSSSEERGYVRAYGIVLKSNESFEVDRAYERKYKTLSGGTLPTAEQVTKRGYVFMGWYKDAAFTDGPYTEVPAGTTGKVTYYARFIKQG